MDKDTLQKIVSAAETAQEYLTKMWAALPPNVNRAALVMACLSLAVSIVKMTGGNRQTIERFLDIIYETGPLLRDLDRLKDA